MKIRRVRGFSQLHPTARHELLASTGRHGLATNMIHFGDDLCNRVLVLQRAGYAIRECSQLPELESALRSSSRPSAVVVSQTGKESFASAIRLAHAATPAPLPVIFFAHAIDSISKHSGADLVVPPFTTPDRWLRWIATLIEQSYAIRAASISLREQAVSLRQGAAASAERFAYERRSAEQLLDEMDDFLEFEDMLELNPNPALRFSRLPN